MLREDAASLVAPHGSNPRAAPELASPQQKAPVKQPQLACLVAEPQRPSRVERRGADAKAPYARSRRGVGDLLRQRLGHALALAHDEQPVVRRRVDGAVELRAVRVDAGARRDVEHQLFQALEVRSERGEVLGVHVAESDDRELQLLLDSLVYADDARGASALL